MKTKQNIKQVFNIICINPGSTSMKLALYKNNRCAMQESVKLTDIELDKFSNIFEQVEYRHEMIMKMLENWPLPPLRAVVGRGGLFPPLAAGVYEVNKKMLDTARKAERGEHASNLGAPLARLTAENFGCPAYIVDPVSVDELLPEMRISGLAGIERTSMSHALNIRAVSHRFAKRKKMRLDKLNLVVAHLGSGVSMAAIMQGRMIDVLNPRDEGAFSPARSGGLPLFAALKKYTAPPVKAYKEIEDELFNNAGVYSYLKTRDMQKVGRMLIKGDKKAALIHDALALQVAKGIYEMAASLSGKVDAVILTGGMAYDRTLIAKIKKRVKAIASVAVFAGEDELKAMAEGALRVLTGKEKAKRL